MQQVRRIEKGTSSLFRKLEKLFFFSEGTKEFLIYLKNTGHGVESGPLVFFASSY